MKLRFVYTPKPKQFAYKPRYYNPEEEEKNFCSNPDGTGKATQEAYRRWKRDTSRLRQRRNQSVIIYVLIILILLYIIFF